MSCCYDNLLSRKRDCDANVSAVDPAVPGATMYGVPFKHGKWTKVSRWKHFGKPDCQSPNG
ncbi:hypothetical protein CCHR01_01904 [Colletotrichum chrysophilum]|uniref:Uncharacterized protein n=1 Tax=Colletotrichum chrysophilum TaxID=1836956 RepID=A0AAD9AVN4_9PEZI|nr:hypothetical protein CCHR01_01904 [Colletotrichum chrysophilum]